jgi:hypothetical protein
MDMEQHDAETFDVEKKFAEARAKKKEKFYGLNDFEICKKGQKKPYREEGEADFLSE